MHKLPDNRLVSTPKRLLPQLRNSGEEVMQKLPYAAWVNLELAKKPEAIRQQARNNYYSYSARIIRYDAYKAYCKAHKRTPDGPPEGYYEYHTHAGHQIIAIITGILGIFGYVLIGLLGGAARPRR